MMTTTGKKNTRKYNHFMIYLLEPVDMRRSEDKEKKTVEKTERSHQTTVPFHAPAEEKETAKSGWVCVALYLCCPRLICDSLQP